MIGTLNPNPANWQPSCERWMIRVGGSVCMTKRIHATCAWVWAVGCVGVKVQQTSLNIHDSDNGRCLIAQRSQGGNLWTCRPVVDDSAAIHLFGSRFADE
eukprot:1160255-Pelagomonas_calceolata.AAC.2